jgi:glycosyltransferase involved in cell wall biosynthesis
MSVHNYRLICPNGLFMSRNGICEKCSGGKELNCIRYNCENSLFKSTGYALRNWFARKKRYYLDNVDIFATLTEFQRQKLIEHGFPEEKVALLPNMNKMESESNNKQGDYVAYVGRLSEEKGIDLIISAASKLPQIKFRMAGHGAEQFRDNAPSNLEFCGCLSDSELDKFYSNCRFLVMTSLCYETFGLVAVEAMFHGKAVIASDIGVLPEVIGGNDYGMTFNPENGDDFISKVEYLWDNPKYSVELGKKACERALLIYSPKVYYKKLMTIYKQNL